MNNLELQKKAENFIKEKKWDFYLVDLFLNTNHFHAWIKLAEFDDYNFGLINLSFSSKEISLKYGSKSIDFLHAKFEDINFSIGGYHDSISLPDDNLNLLTVFLFIDEKIVMNIRYKEPNYDFSSLSSEYKIFSVEEFHNHQSLNDLLIKTSEANKQKEKERNRKRRIERDNSYKDKFSFD